MKKLNNKGYMLIEVILASVIAFVMAYFLIDITIKLINKNNDYYVEGTLLADRNIITKEIMDDVNSRNLVMITQNNSKNYTFTFNDGESVVKKDLIFSDDNVITYGDYSKKLNDLLTFGDVEITYDERNKILTFKVPAYTNYSTFNYGFNFVIPYKENFDIELPGNCSAIKVIYDGVTKIYENTASLDYDTSNTYKVMLSSGSYVIDAYGAQGANSSDNSYTGGKGGFVSGKITFNGNTTLDVKLGGQGGFNGGGASTGSGSYSGGGATTVYLGSNRLISAAGGGGASLNGNGEDGGTGDATGGNNGSNGGGGSGKNEDVSTGEDCDCNGDDNCSYTAMGGPSGYQDWCYCSVEIGVNNSPPSGYSCGSMDKYGMKTCEKDFAASCDRNYTTVSSGGNGGTSVVSSNFSASSKRSGVNTGNGKFTITCTNCSDSPKTDSNSCPSIVVTDSILNENKVLNNVTYDYTTPGSQELTLESGSYVLEVWGAQGGSTEDGTGGKGGYSRGTLTLTADSTNIFIYVGGKGGGGYLSESHRGSFTASGGFNGGGDGYGTHGSNSNYSTLNAGGGGASDIRLGTDSLYARVIVAGGGGGAGHYYYGGTGGGTTGGDGSNSSDSAFTGSIPGYGGTQKEAGATFYSRGNELKNERYGFLADFGVGGGYNANSEFTGYRVGGGGGWYGGGFSFGAGGGGGSGYVYTSSTEDAYPSGCLLNSNYYLTDTSMSNGENRGDGKVTITTLDRYDYKIPRILGLTDLSINKGDLVNLNTDISYKCESDSPNGCTYIGVKFIDTSIIEKGTYYLCYVIKSSKGIEYSYIRKLIVK